MTATEVPTPFKVAKVRPPLVDKGKISQSLARGEVLGVGVQVVAPDGGETNLHSHPGLDSSWMVLGGEATFYGEEDQEVARLTRNELIFIPAGTPYWFKASSEEPLVILHITARLKGFEGPGRIDYQPYRDKPGQVIPGAFFEA